MLWLTDLKNLKIWRFENLRIWGFEEFEEFENLKIWGFEDLRIWRIWRFWRFEEFEEFEDLKIWRFEEFEDLKKLFLLNQFKVKIIYNCTQLQLPFRACPPWRRVWGRLSEYDVVIRHGGQVVVMWWCGDVKMQIISYFFWINWIIL